MAKNKRDIILIYKGRDIHDTDECYVAPTKAMVERLLEKPDGWMAVDTTGSVVPLASYQELF